MTSPNDPAGGSTSGTGLPQNVAGALTYVLGLITGILFLVIERENRFVRFHAMQSTVFCVAWIALAVVLGLFTTVPVLGWILGVLLSGLVSLVGLLLWLFLMWQAFQGKEWEIPVLGAFARKQLGGTA